MTLITVAIYSDGTRQEQLSDEVTPSAHIFYDTDGTTVLSSVPASQWELDLLRQAAPVPAKVPLSGHGPPANSVGADSDVYIDVDSNFSYGPKAGGVWPVGAVVVLPRA
jgi:hypothetical protein